MAMLSGKTAVVTGSTSGIGLGIAKRLAAQGANLMLNGFGDAGEIEKLRAGLESEFGVKVAYDGADVSKYDAVAAMVDRAAAELGGAHIVVNNAGIQHVATVEDFPLDRWDAVIALNLTGVFYGCRAAIPHMKKQGYGRLINIASTHGLVASAQKSAYVAAKHGVIGLTKVVALELAETGVTCNAICPGWTLTPLVQKQIDAAMQQKGLSQEEAEHAFLEEKQPTMRWTTAEQLGDAAVFLCSSGADNMTGTQMVLDGGWVAR